MTPTLKQELLDEIAAIDARCEQLRRHYLEYKEEKQFEFATRSEIKYNHLKMISNRLKKIIIKTSK